MIDLSNAFLFLAVTAICLTVILCFCIYFGVNFKWRDHEVLFVPGKKEDKDVKKIKDIEAKLDDIEGKVEGIKLDMEEEPRKKNGR